VARTDSVVSVAIVFFLGWGGGGVAEAVGGPVHWGFREEMLLSGRSVRSRASVFF
jgi:hypothetical protein